MKPEELIIGLANVAGLKVASQLSSFALKNQKMDVRLMGEQLDVDHILSGSVQKADDRVRISVQLSRVKDGSSLWSKFIRLKEAVSAGLIRGLMQEWKRRTSFATLSSSIPQACLQP